jgi:hypothetical protein
MTREDLFGELGGAVLLMTPTTGFHEDVTLEDVEDVRRTFADLMDRIAMRVTLDMEMTAEDVADDILQQEQDERESEGVGLD